MKKIFAAVIIAVAAILFSSFYLMVPSGQSIAESYKMEKYIVTRITDGDTIVLESGEPVRLLGIDTPERGQPCYKESSARLKELIYNKEVEVERDKEDKDRYKRLLRYIFYNGTFVNELLVREGYAHLYFIEPNVKYNDILRRAAQQAKAEGTGCLWKSV